MRGTGFCSAAIARMRRPLLTAVVGTAVALPMLVPAARAAAPEARHVIAPVVVARKATVAPPAFGNGPVRLVFGHKVG